MGFGDSTAEIDTASPPPQLEQNRAGSTFEVPQDWQSIGDILRFSSCAATSNRPRNRVSYISSSCTYLTFKCLSSGNQPARAKLGQPNNLLNGQAVAGLGSQIRDSDVARLDCVIVLFIALRSATGADDPVAKQGVV